MVLDSGLAAGSGGVERVVVMGWWARSESELLIGGGFVYPFPKCCRKCNTATTEVLAEHQYSSTTLSNLTPSVTMPLGKTRSPLRYLKYPEQADVRTIKRQLLLHLWPLLYSRHD